MPQSIFDPRSTQTERSGSTFLGGHAQDHSQMPPDLIDGEVSDEEAADLQMLNGAHDPSRLPGLIAPFDDPPLASLALEERENVELPGIL